MAEAIDLSLRHLSSEDIAALTRYLRTVPAQRSELAARVVHDPGTLNGATAWSPGADPRRECRLPVYSLRRARATTVGTAMVSRPTMQDFAALAA